MKSLWNLLASGCTVVVISLCAAPRAGAQSQLLGNASRATQASGTCGDFVLYEPPPQQPMEKKTAENLRSCLESELTILGTITHELNDAKEGVPVEVTLPLTNGQGDTVQEKQPIARLDRYLIREHLNVKSLEEWATWFQANKAGSEATRAKIVAERVRGELDDLLTRRGLRELFSAALISGAVVGNGSALADDSGGEQTASALAHLVWESKHFGDDRFKKLDFSFGGRLGFVPALTLVKPVESSDGATPEDEGKAQAVYQEAFAWDIAGRTSFRLSGQRAAEVSLIGKIGQTILGTQSVLLDRGDRSELAVPVNGTTKAELFYEVGLHYNLYNNPLEVVHGEGSTVSPTFHLDVSWRRDNRFKQEKDLVGFDSPADRLVFRFMIDALKVVDRRQLAEPRRVFTFGFGVEHETSLKGDTTVPSGTKLIFRGDIDLLRALQNKR